MHGMVDHCGWRMISTTVGLTSGIGCYQGWKKELLGPIFVNICTVAQRTSHNLKTQSVTARAAVHIGEAQTGMEGSKASDAVAQAYERPSVPKSY